MTPNLRFCQVFCELRRTAR